MIIRQAVLEDVPALSEIEKQSFTDPWSEADIAGDIIDHDRAYVAAVTDAEFHVPAGYADMWIVAGEAQLMNIAVAGMHRGKGYGKALMEHMIDTARKLGCEVMTLEVRISNNAAIGLYSILGFEKTGVRPAYYIDNNEDAVLMDKILK